MFWYRFFEYAPIILFIFGAIAFLVALKLCYLSKYDDNKVFHKVVDIIGYTALAFVIIGVIGVFTLSSQCKRDKYKSDEYDVEQIANDYEAIKKATDGDPYVVHLHGFGGDQWIYYSPENDEMAKYKK